MPEQAEVTSDPVAADSAAGADQDVASAGLESDAAAEEKSAGDAEDTGTDDWKPSWRQQQAANRSGLSEDDLSNLVEAWGPERAMDFLEQRAQQHDDISRLAQGLKSEQHPAKGAEAPEDGEVPEGEFALAAELFDQTWEQPEVVARFMKPVVEELNTMRGVLRAVLAKLQSVGDRTTAMTADTFFSSLGEEQREFFGEGPTNVRSTAPEQQARLRVIRSAEKIAEGFSRAGTPIHPREALERALSMEMGEQLGSIVRSRKLARAKRRAGQTQTGPRGRRKTKPQTRQERKEAFLRGVEKILAGEKYERP